MVRYKIHYKRPTPVEDALRLILVPVFAALLAIGGLVACNDNLKDDSWKHRLAPTTAPVMPQPALRAEIQVTSSTPSSSGTAHTASSVPVTSPAAVARPSELRSSSRAVSSPNPIPAPSTGALSTDSAIFQSSDLQEQRNSSARMDPVPESIQGCQRSAAACFATGGLDTLMNNLDGLAIDPVTGRFCFSFQEGCERR